MNININMVRNIFIIAIVFNVLLSVNARTRNENTFNNPPDMMCGINCLWQIV